jgi:hypothetical protein
MTAGLASGIPHLIQNKRRAKLNFKVDTLMLLTSGAMTYVNIPRILPFALQIVNMDVTSSPKNLRLALLLSVHESALNHSVPFQIVTTRPLSPALAVVNYSGHVSQVKPSF